MLSQLTVPTAHGLLEIQYGIVRIIYLRVYGTGNGYIVLYTRHDECRSVLLCTLCLRQFRSSTIRNYVQERIQMGWDDQ